MPRAPPARSQTDRHSRLADAGSLGPASAISETGEEQMPQRRHHRLPTCGRWLAGCRARCARATRDAWRALRRWQPPTPVAVLIADRTRRRAVERELRCGLTHLQRVLGAPRPAELAIVVQQVITTDRQLAGCYQLGQRPDGSRFALVRLALQVNGRRLTTDELLAVLAEQCIGVLTQHSPSVLVPVELEPGPGEPRRPAPLRPDPLVPHANGTGTGDRSA